MLRVEKLKTSKKFKLAVASLFVFAQLAVPLMVQSDIAVAHHKPNHSQGQAKAKSHNNGKAKGQNKKDKVNAQASSNRSPRAQVRSQSSHQSSLEAQSQGQSSHNPSGNNGTVKIDRLPFDSHPNNQPHVGCTFQVDFYGFDQGVGNATVNFEPHSPTADAKIDVVSGDLTPNIGEDDASGGGSQAGLDASETYKLDFTGQPHPKQGYHVKLTVHATGSQGSDTKHKVYWVEACEPEQDETEGQVSDEAASTARKGDGRGGLVLSAQTQAQQGSLVNTGNPALLGIAISTLLISVAAGVSMRMRMSEHKQAGFNNIAL